MSEGGINVYAFAVVAIFVIVIVFVSFSIVVVHDGFRVVVARFGKDLRVLRPGVHFVPVFVYEYCWLDWRMQTETGTMTPHMKDTVDIDMRPCTLDFPPCSAFTRDGVLVQLNGTLDYVVTDARLAVTSAANPLVVIAETVSLALRDSAAKYDVHLITRYRLAIVASVFDKIRDVGKQYGIHLTRFDVQDICVPDSVLEEFERAAVAEHRHEFDMKELARAELRANARQKILTVEAESNAIVAAKKYEASVTATRMLWEHVLALPVEDRSVALGVIAARSRVDTAAEFRGADATVFVKASVDEVPDVRVQS